MPDETAFFQLCAFHFRQIDYCRMAQVAFIKKNRPENQVQLTIIQINNFGGLTIITVFLQS